MPILATASTAVGTKRLTGSEVPNYKYRYPNGLKLNPRSELHGKIVDMVMQRANASRSFVDQRFDSWSRIDDTMTAFVELDSMEAQEKQKDPRKPFSIVVPTSYAIRETWLTYMVQAYFEQPYFRYKPTGPEDYVGALLMEQVINNQCNIAKIPLAMYQQWSDNFTYGFGVTTPVWDIRRSKRRKARPRNQAPIDLFGEVDDFDSEPFAQDIQFEGNRLDNIDPYHYLPDPSVPVYTPQRGTYVGWVERTNRMSILSDEKSESLWYNARYLNHIDGRSALWDPTVSNRDQYGYAVEHDAYGDEVDIIHMYINLIPAEHGLGRNEYPELWVFAVAGDSLVLRAEPADLDHQLFPVSVMATEFTSRLPMPISLLEIAYPMQEAVNWMYSSHINNVRKALNDVLIVDPQLVNMKDLLNPGPGKVVRLRESMLGRGVKDAVEQLKVTDVTQQHVGDSAVLIELMQRITGAVDSVQGIQRKTSAEVSATEAGATHTAALSKLEKNARISSIQAHFDTGWFLMSNTQQFASIPTYVEFNTGRMKEDFLHIFGPMAQVSPDGRLRVYTNPDDLRMGVDVIPHDGTIPTNGDIQSLIQLFQLAVPDPELRQGIDMVRMYLDIARRAGHKNVIDFLRTEQPIQTEIQSPEQIQNNPNLTPLSGVA